ncbi:hypothetical protein [Bradyrhizobium icense]|uniref:Uncharacterized protein n=1 Tax=Bradyrhizobium icense TaxID=1274631 RepID=A0A1B1UD59_9BRAD|nr:hypothetical protein [Bradyrhizobium icense]ANW00671.1 hypothetical protein LMTR13_11330 [Bradyrhizobium icense]
MTTLPPSPFTNPDQLFPRGFNPEAFLAAIEEGAEEIDAPAFISDPSDAYLEAIEAMQEYLR